MPNHLFVYGSLAPGRPNAHVLAPLNGAWQPATVQGELRLQGWGARFGYPGLVLDATAGAVQGFLFSSAQLADFWRALDEFEGAEYLRELTTAQLEDGSSVEAWVYALRPE